MFIDQTAIMEFFSSYSLPYDFELSDQGFLAACIALTAVAAIVYSFGASAKETVDVPTVTVGSTLLPSIYSRLTFSSNAPIVIANGYRKYKNAAFKCLRPSDDLVVLPIRYCEELRALPDTKLNALEATFTDHVGDYTTILSGSHLHTDAIQKRLTPSLPRSIPGMVGELDHAFRMEFPACTDWVPIKPFPMFLRIVARAGSRPWVGETLCRNEIWLDAAVNFMLNIFKAYAILRSFPKVLHPIVSRLLPCIKDLQRQLGDVKALIVPVIDQRRAAEKEGGLDYQKPNDFLQDLVDLANNDADEADADNLAHRLLGIMSMAVVPTTTVTVMHSLFDLICMPEYLEPLRDEISSVLPDDWTQSTQADLAGLKRLDSFMRESQRMNPPGELSFHRIVKQSMTLSDGLKLPAGTHICMPSGPVAVDGNIVHNANTFDGFRWFRENKSTASFVSVSATNLHFGLGRYACPGRFFASYMIKGILSRMLLDYDFKFADEQHGRPENMILGDKIIPNLQTDIWVRRRRAAKEQ